MLFVHLLRFCILVSGTLIYGRGDEVEEKEIIAELTAEVTATTSGFQSRTEASHPATAGCWRSARLAKSSMTSAQ